jgi:hypothetical protein
VTIVKSLLVQHLKRTLVDHFLVGEILQQEQKLNVKTVKINHDKTQILRTFPTGHPDTIVPLGGGFSEALLDFSVEIILMSASSTRTSLSLLGFLRHQQDSLVPLLLA